MKLTPQAVLGLIIVGVGLLLTADNLNIVESEYILRYWPLFIVAVGLTKVAQSDTTAGKVFGGVMTLLGVLLTLEEVWAIELDVDRWWPLALVAVGSFIVYRAARGGSACAATGPSTTDQQVSEFAIWSGKMRKNPSPNFRRADLTAVMGGIELDLRGASTQGEAVIDVFVWWGGIEITVPPDWAVSNQVVVIMGGADDSSTGTQDSRNRLVVRGFCVMGGVDIKVQ